METLYLYRQLRQKTKKMKENSTITEDFKKYAKSELNIPSLTIDDYKKNVQNDLLMNPMILEERKLNVTPLDIFSRMLLDRTIFLTHEITTESCGIAIAQLLYLDSIEERDINMNINSPGGSCYDGLALVDTMNFIKSDVSTMNMGMSASMGAIILISGEKGKRFSLPHSRVMIHQPSTGGGTRKYSDLKIELDEMQKTKQDLYEILAENMGKTIDEIDKICKDDTWLTSKEAVDMKIIDKIIEKKP